MLALLVRVDNLDDNSSRSFSFAQSPVRIGRNTLNDLPLEWPFVSQWHAVVSFDDNAAAYYDMGSTNGTTVQGQRLGKHQPVPIAPGLEFRIGALRLTFSRANLPAGMAAPGTARVSEGLRGRSAPSLAEADVGSTMMLDTTALLGAAGIAAPGAAPQRPAGQVMGPARNAVLALRPYYAAYRQSWNDLQQAMMATLQQVPAHQIPAALSLFLDTFPDASHEPQLKALAQSQNVPVPGVDSGAVGDLVARLAQHLVPGRAPPASAQEVEGFLVRLMVAMEIFGAAFVGLRKSRDEFGAEVMGSSHRSADPTPVEGANDARSLLAYLLDWSGDGDQRMQDLKGHYAEIMTHQVALLSGLMEGVRTLVRNQLSPAEIARQAESDGGFLNFGPFKNSALWNRFVQVHNNFTEDNQLTSAVFGRDFLKAYYAALGKNYADGGPRRIGGGAHGR